ncbi:MAG TPA: type IV pilus secretin PilQ [Pyrinomonadaceae bacterium]|nr:type IV pilus secretin PilQ [Pyrinomonadaceae bacterium]
MNSLQSLCGYGRKAIVALMIISTLTFTTAAQTVAPQEQGKRYGDPGFVGEPANLKVVNTDIRDILSYITETYGINFVIDKSVGAVPVTVNVSDVPWNVALDSILRSQDLGVQVNGSILRIADQKTLADEQSVQQRIRDSQLDVSPLYTEFIRLNYARASNTLGTEGGGASQFVGGSTSSSNPGNGGASAGGSADQGILGIVKRRLSRRGGIEVDGRSNTLIITDVRENIDAVRQLVSLLDQPEPQVEIESRIVVASRSFSRDLGFQLSAVLVDTGRGAGGIFSTLGGSANNNATSGNGTAGNPGTGFTFPEPNGRLGGTANTIIGLTTGVIGTARINALLTAGEQKGQVKTIATPRITTLNNRPAEIESGSQIPITTVQPGSGTGVAIVATTEYVPVPLRLAVTPQITDVGTVILNVVAENNTVPNSFGGTPTINTQRMTTQVMVPDGGTTVVGGALFDQEGEITDRTPGLSSIPILGNIFKRKQVTRSTNEVLFFITPRIYRPDYQGNPTSGTISNGQRSTTIIQPVPLGNPATNSEMPRSAPQQQNPQTQTINPLLPVVQPLPNTPNRP